MFKAETLRKTGDGCFAQCLLLSRISCNLEPEKFTCYGCDECPVCYHDLKSCLRRGSGENEKNVMIDEKVLEAVLKKYSIGITVKQALKAKEGQIISDCLILKEEHYQAAAFSRRSDFRSVLALRLRHVSNSMFEEAKTLTTAIMPEAVWVMYGSFMETGLQDCYFPKLVKIYASAFK